MPVIDNMFFGDAMQDKDWNFPGDHMNGLAREKPKIPGSAFYCYMHLHATLTRWKRQYRDAGLRAGPHEDMNKKQYPVSF